MSDILVGGGGQENKYLLVYLGMGGGGGGRRRLMVRIHHVFTGALKSFIVAISQPPLVGRGEGGYILNS